MPSILESLRERFFPPPPPSLIERREERTFKDGSPFYTHELPILAFGNWTGVLNVNDLFPDAQKYAPLDYIEVTNNGAVALMLEIDYKIDGQFPVPAGTIRGRVDKPFRSFRLYNQDAAADTVAGLVHITIQRQPTSIDRWARGERK